MNAAAPALLGPTEPLPYEVLNPHASRPLLFVCEHASDNLPERLRGAYPEALMRTHYGCDIGADALVRQLAEALDARAVVARYSRIVIDCNRRFVDPTLILDDSELGPVAPNSNLSAADRDARIHEIFAPFHAAVSAEIDALTTDAATPVYVAIHSFTPELTGSPRPWDMGVMWDADPRLAQRLHEALHGTPGLLIGDNEPYSGKHAADFSVDFHAERLGLANVALEIRQDHLQSASGVSEWAVRLAGALDELVRSHDLLVRQPLRQGIEFPREAATIEAAAQRQNMARQGDSRDVG